ncbi:PREDICTED: probable glycosyltransferase At5g03795 [Brassica oleracea var. oleracea]|uniref:Exostosin GT47 domain-containing protein n=1 Tax=Brassica oleracea var. oleracea TaxID=109376 RepID=A0A0D3BLR8_BRAOL|nr:PREDICTED: probable glycosyltransferase At5g03795 [Brassica oleracea var. oleracea]XP_013622757.1 PREDICTED: probable glycosyltransferase At5g03795 [Brassica oleracea var. oleracea]XP_013622758.1 PREDICTED: probable glycosyltransferase At5g03795 [Brassica oleracea var. oleracea]
MKLLRSAGVVFVFILAFQFVNIHYYGGDIFSLSSRDEFPVSIHGNTESIRPLSGPVRVNVSSWRSAEGERAGLEEDYVTGSDTNVSVQSHDDSFVETRSSLNGSDADTVNENNRNVENALDSLVETRSSLNGSYVDIVEDAEIVNENNRNVETLESKSDDNLSPEVKRVMNVSNSGVVSISEMMSLLHQSRTTHVSLKMKRPSAVDQELLYARTQIENSPKVENGPLLHGPLYWNLSVFKRSYELMESKLKVYVYREGKRPVFHKPVLKGIYASEGWFMRQLKASKTFVTKNPRKSHLFYLPFSSKMLEESLYVPGSHSDKNLVKFLKNYLDMISSKYHFWNKTGGSDHFLVACHDWAPSETRQYMSNSIRALCNSDVSEGFVFGKDVALPETTILVPRRPLRALGGKPTSQRHILAFFAGGMHGYLRPLLLQTWGGNRDPDMKIFSEIPKSKGKNKSYMEFMKSSKYCICPKGHEVNSPRVVEALFYECVPVIISDNFVPPFFEVINWESFAVFVLEKDIPDLKNILLSISEERYREMQMRVKMVQKHFLWHSKPERFDIFHMILHSIWYNRVFQT